MTVPYSILEDWALSKSAAEIRKTSELPQFREQPPLLLGVGQACNLRTRPLPFRRAVARRELDSDGALLRRPLLRRSNRGIMEASNLHNWFELAADWTAHHLERVKGDQT